MDVFLITDRNSHFEHGISLHEHTYEKMLENIANKVVTNLSDNMSYQPAFAQKELYGQQAFHPNFDAIVIGSNNTTNSLYDNQKVRILD